ncbi:unnamed protein product [Prunus brigantina]
MTARRLLRKGCSRYLAHIASSSRRAVSLTSALWAKLCTTNECVAPGSRTSTTSHLLTATLASYANLDPTTGQGPNKL